MLGPLFYYDLLRTSRRTRFIAVRCVYALALLVALFCLYASWFGIGSFGEPLSPNREAAFATDFFFTFLAVQLAAVLLLTPAYTSVAVAEEREAGRLDFLLTSELSNREIVLGKFAARLGSVALILLTGLPILGLMQFLGGVDPNLVLVGFAISLATMCSVGSFGVWVSICCEKASSALWLTYLCVGLALGLFWCCPLPNFGHPVVAYHQLDSALRKNEDLADALPALIGWYAGIHGTLALAFLTCAVYFLRPPVVRPAVSSLAKSKLFPSPSLHTRQRLFHRPPVSDDALLWKEQHLYAYRLVPGLQDTAFVLAALAIPYAIVIGLAVFVRALESDQLGEFSYALARYGGVPLASLILLGIALRTAASVSQEREQGTLDSLLTLPIDRREILSAKLLGSILSVGLWLGALAVIWLCCALAGGLHPLSGLLLVGCLLVYAGCTAALGLYCSIVSSNRRYATLLTLLGLFLWNGVPWLFSQNFSLLSPVLGLWELAFPPHDRLRIRWGEFTPSGSSLFVDKTIEVHFACMGAVFAVVIGKILWGLANYYFEAERGPESAE